MRYASSLSAIFDRRQKNFYVLLLYADLLLGILKLLIGAEKEENWWDVRCLCDMRSKNAMLFILCIGDMRVCRILIL